MASKVIVPDIGDFENVEIIEILVKSGDKVKKNDSIVTLESDKSSVEVPSTAERDSSHSFVSTGSISPSFETSIVTSFFLFISTLFELTF